MRLAILSQIEFGPDDLIMSVIHYLPSLVFAVIASLIVIGAIVVIKRQWPKSNCRKNLGLCLVPIPMICWVIYFGSTLGFTETSILLNSESAQVAEKIYETRFKKQINTLDSAVCLAVDKRQAPNVRFYASCLIADMLATNDDTVVVKVSKTVENAPTIETQFIGGNELTDEFVIQGHVQPPLSVRGIIEKRLLDIRQSKR